MRGLSNLIPFFFYYYEETLNLKNNIDGKKMKGNR
jgi:hypothetical protein